MDANPEMHKQQPDPNPPTTPDLSKTLSAELVMEMVAAEQDKKLVALFTYHPPTEMEKGQYAAINEAALNLARVILLHCPACADRTAAIRKVREARMTANAAIACHGVSL